MLNRAPLPDLRPFIMVDEDTALPPDLTTPLNLQTVFLGGLFILALFSALYVAASIILPIILAIVLSLVLRPLMRVLEKIHVPRQIGALIIMLLLFGGMFGLGSVLSTPAAQWAQELPAGMSKIQSRLHEFMKPLQATKNAIQNGIQNAVISNPTNATHVTTVTIQSSPITDRLLTNTQSLVSGIGETILVLFFLLATGDIFLRRFIEILPRFQDKRQTVLITQQIESDISAYLAIITLTNAVVGIATGCAVAYTGLADPVLWGTIAFLLNYAPIIGPLIGLTLFTMAGLLSSGSIPGAFVPAILYLTIHLTEAFVLTPLLLSKRFTLNPVLVVLGVIFWFWLWGVPGAILATPMLAVTKIICAHVRSLVPFGHFIEG